MSGGIYIGGMGDTHTWPAGTRDPADDEEIEWEDMTREQKLARLIECTRLELAEMYLEALEGPLA